MRRRGRFSSLLVVIWKILQATWWPEETTRFVLGSIFAACGLAGLRLLCTAVSARYHYGYGTCMVVCTSLEIGFLVVVLTLLAQNGSPIAGCFQHPSADGICLYVVR